jgi:AAA family ATPase
MGYIAPRHFVETYYNGIIRRLVVDTVRGVPSPLESSTLDPAKTIYALSRLKTEISFKPPPSRLVKRKPATAATASGAGGKATPVAVADGGELAGYEAVGGMERQIEEIRELVEWPLTRPELFKHFGLRPPKGVLLYGPPGTGKTLLAFSIAKSTGSTLFTINGPSLSSAYHGETEKALRDIFLEAKRKSPSIIVIDEVDALAPNREEGGEVERRVVAQLLTLMDGLEEKDPEPKAKEEDDEDDDEDDDGEEKDQEPPRVVVIAATNRPNAIDPALRRPGRFDKEIEIGVPDAAARLSILRVLLRRTPHNLPDDVLVSVAGKTHGFVGADLSSLVHTAGLSALKRSFPKLGQAGGPALSSMKLEQADLEHALLSTRPSAMREVFLETPKVLWSDIGGQEEVKSRLRESVEWPLRHPETFTRLGVKPPRGILLYGPPGCSKTLIAKALATEGGLNFIAVKGPEVSSRRGIYVAGTER